MLKRPVTKTATAAPAKAPLKLSGLKRTVPIEKQEPAEEEAAEEEEPPKAVIKKKVGASAAPVKTGQSLADLFDNTKPTRGGFPIGTFNAYVVSFELVGEIADDMENQGPLYAQVTYEGHEDEEECVEKNINSRYTIVDDKGQPSQGMGFLRGDLELYGYEDVGLGQLEECFAAIVAERPIVVIKVSEKNGYTNAYLQGMAQTE